MGFLIGFTLGVGIGAFLCWVWFAMMLGETNQLLSEKEPKLKQEAV